MLSEKRIESLQSKKAIIARRIEQEERSPSTDTTSLRQLKKQKLELSEIINGIRHDGETLQ